MRCESCGVAFSGALARCPLCQGELSGEPSAAVFPPQRSYLRPRRLAAQIITFAAGSALLVLAFLTYLLAWPLPITAASAAATVISVLFVNSAILHAPRPLRIVFRYWYVMLATALVWFAATGSLIVTAFVIPIMCLASLAFDVVVLIVLGANGLVRYAKYFAFDIVCGLMPMAFVPLGWAPWDVLAMVSGLVALLLALGLLVFARRQLFGEFRKLFSA